MRIVLMGNGRTGRMGRLVDIDRLCDDLVKRWSIADKKKEDTIRAVMADVVTPIVASQPTVDAVEVVRCKDCRHHHYQHGIPYCDRIDYGYGWQDYDFCSHGERKDGDADGV